MDSILAIPPLGQSQPTRESSRKRVRKTLGPDFIEDFSVHRAKPEDERMRIPPPITRRNMFPGVMKKQNRNSPTIAKSAGFEKRPKLLAPMYRGGSLRVCSECIKKNLGDGAYEDQDEILRCAGNCGYAAHRTCLSAENRGKYVSGDWYCGKCALALERRNDIKPKKVTAAGQKTSMYGNGAATKKVGKKAKAVNGKRLDRKPKGARKAFGGYQSIVNLPIRERSPTSSEEMDDMGEAEPEADDEETSSGWFFGQPELMQFPMPEFEEEENPSQEEDQELRGDLASWTIEQGAAYFQDSFPELAKLIKTHELWGTSLLMLSRQQFLTLFSLPLGTALKMHAAVCKCRRNYF